MCETGEKCKRSDTFWVQSRREIRVAGNPELGIEPFTSGISVMSCGSCLPSAVRSLRAAVEKGYEGPANSDTLGVVVKVRADGDRWI